VSNEHASMMHAIASIHTKRAFITTGNRRACVDMLQAVVNKASETVITQLIEQALQKRISKSEAVVAIMLQYRQDYNVQL
jgi:hypothetical protein